jgi:hypothetical protein
MLQELRAQLKELERRTLCLASAAVFRRVENEEGEIETLLLPTEEQKQEAGASERSLQQWSAGVQSILRRRGSPLHANVAQLADELAEYVLLRITDIADVTEYQWRMAFAGAASQLTVKLLGVLEEAAEAFSVAEKRMPMRHETFSVIVRQIADSLWSVELAAANGRCVTASVSLDLTEFESFVSASWQGKRTTSLDELVQLGQLLFAGIFTSAGKELYFSALEEAIVRGCGIRLRLDVAGAGRLATVPWELLNDGQRFLGLSAATPVTRKGSRARSDPRPRSSPIRILVTISSPPDLRYIDAEAERRLIEAAVAPLVAVGFVAVDVDRDGTLGTLRRRMSTAADGGRPYDIWHFIGHGRYDERRGQGELAMRGPGREARYVGRTELNAIFGEHPPLQLVVLNACEGARGDLQTAVAAIFLGCGVEAVLAMQFVIGDAAAGILADELYGALSEGLSIEAAVTEIRRGIFCQGHSIDWMIPALFIGDDEQRPEPAPAILHSLRPY